MGCGVCMLKCLLILFNVIFGLIGLVFLGVGAFVLASGNNTIRPHIEEALKSIPGLPAGFNLQNSTQITVDGLNLNITDVIRPVAICLIVLGTFLLITSIFGSFGSCCSNKCMLFTYATIVLILVLVQMLLLILFFTGSLDGTIKGQMKHMIVEDYVAIDDFTFPSLVWNVVMTNYKCCGANDHTDFDTAKKWKRKRTVKRSGKDVEVILAIPFACCKFKNPFPNLEPIDETCVTTPTDANANENKGCFAALWKALDGVMLIAKGAGAGLLVFQILCALAAIAIGHQISKEKGQTV